MKKEKHREKVNWPLFDKLKKEEGEVQKYEANLVFDGSQFLVRFPKRISKALKIKKGEKVIFTLTMKKGTKSKKGNLEIRFR